MKDYNVKRLFKNDTKMSVDPLQFRQATDLFLTFLDKPIVVWRKQFKIRTPDMNEETRKSGEMKNSTYNLMISLHQNHFR